MLNESADLLVSLLEKYHCLSDEERPVYVYGFELLISTLSSMTTIFCISLLINNLCYALFFFLFFFTLRLSTGGYHAKTYLKCFITTNIIFISTILLTELALFLEIKRVFPILVTISTAIVWIFSPIINNNHPCSDETYIKNKTKARFLSALYSLIFIYIYYFTSFDDIAINSAWHLIMVSVMIIIEKIKTYGEVKNNELYQFKNC